jgi:hypothetical protein
MRYFKGTGIRLDSPGVFVVDIDIADPVLYAKVLKAYRKRWPDFFKGALERTSGGVKRAFIGRISKPYKQNRTHRYTSDTLGVELRKGELTKEQIKALPPLTDNHQVEIFGEGSRGRYFAIEGPHNTPDRFYSFIPPDRSPFTVRLDSLPEFPFEDTGPLVDLADEILGKHLTRVPNSAATAIGRQYDLVPGMTFISKDGEEIELTALEAQLAPGAEHGIYGCQSWEAWRWSSSHGHAKAFVSSRTGRLIIENFQDSTEHRWETEKPEPPVELSAESIAVLKALKDGAKSEAGGDTPPRSSTCASIERHPDPEMQQVTHNNAVRWLTEHVAWYALAFKGRGGAVSIDPDGEFPTPVALASLRETMRDYGYWAVPRGGRVLKHHNPVDQWAMNGQRLKVSGIRMRPELPLMFEDDGGVMLNRYVAPIHSDEGGSIDPFIDRMEALIPNDDERDWVWNWMACLVQHPEWRMVGLAMLAREMGTGRGLWAETLQLVLGERFVVNIPYSKLAGGSGSRFNAEVADKLLVYVNEAPKSDDHKYYNKHAAKEALKDFVEPNHRIPFRVEPKGVDAYYTRAAVSTALFTNNIGGVPIGEGDRRMAVVINGAQMTVAERDAFQAWMLMPANIGALFRWLRDCAVESDKSIFDPYMAPTFHGRDLMIEAGKTALDFAWEAATERLREASDLYAMSQVVALTRQIAKSHNSDFDDLVRKHTVHNGHRIGVKDGPLWHVRYGGEKERVYAHDSKAARRWSKGDTRDVKAELDKAQQVVNAPNKVFNKMLRVVE